ncbi:MAG: bifunctional DNA primase/polymerase [Geminicoccaceae bacterium]
MSGVQLDAGGRDPLTPLRLQLRKMGYPPVPVAGPRMRCKTPGKQPVMPDWRQRCLAADDAEVSRWEEAEPGCINTGILCDRLAAVDIDVPVPKLAARVEALAVALLGETPLRRIGRAPKVLRLYRPEVPLSKMETPELFLPDGTKVQVEILGRGQQFVAFGTHPDTGQDYEWLGSGPDVVPLAELPVVTEADLREFLAAAEGMLRAAGGRTAKEIEAAEVSPTPEPVRRAQNRKGAEPGGKIEADPHDPRQCDMREVWNDVERHLPAVLPHSWCRDMDALATFRLLPELGDAAARTRRGHTWSA